MFDNYEALIAAITKAKKTPILLSLEKISKLNHFQVRNVASNTVHIDTIAERINDKLCTTEGMEPIIILQNYKGADSMLDGNHRYRAALKSCATEYPVIYVEEKIHSNYSDLQLREYALILNKIDEEPSLQINKEDVRKFLNAYWNEHKNFDNVKVSLRRMGLTDSMANTRIRETKRLIDQNTILQSYGPDSVWNNWSDPAMLERKNQEIEKRKDRADKIFVVSSANFTYDHILPMLLDQMPKSLLILLHHPNAYAEQQWKAKWRERHELYMDKLCEMLNMTKSWETLPKHSISKL
tara:strand:+ start:1234 stop:2121 length:888 start_codon:yes stop_codon:yes gene_type:complete